MISIPVSVLLLTKRPTRVAEILQYDKARPRTVATPSDPGFVAAKKLSLEIFQREGGARDDERRFVR